MLKAMDADRQVGAMELYASSYLLTGDETYREQLQTSNEQLSDILNRISALVSDNPLQERRLLELSGLRGKWMATAAQLNASAHGRNASVAAFRELSCPRNTSRAGEHDRYRRGTPGKANRPPSTRGSAYLRAGSRHVNLVGSSYQLRRMASDYAGEPPV
jgi:CHASE3 domain